MYEEEADRLEEGYLYRVLGVSKHASVEELRNAYRKAAWESHPDRVVGKEVAFEETSQAYTVLSNRKYRLLYNLLGDPILPVITEQKYAVYIEKLVDARILSLLVVELLFALCSTLFYPYLLLLVRGAYITYTQSLFPLFLSFFLGSFLTAFLVGGQDTQRVNIFLCFLQGISVLGMALTLSLFLDGRICWIGLILGYIGCFHMYTMIILARKSKYIRKSSFSSTLLLSKRSLLSKEYLLFLGYSSAQMLSFLVPSGRVGYGMQAMSLPVYVYSLSLLGVISQNIGVFLLVGALIVLVPVLVVQKEELGGAEKVFIFLFFLVKIFLIFLGSCGIWKSVQRAQWLKCWRQQISDV